MISETDLLKYAICVLRPFKKCLYLRKIYMNAELENSENCNFPNSFFYDLTINDL